MGRQAYAPAEDAIGPNAPAYAERCKHEIQGGTCKLCRVVVPEGYDARMRAGGYVCCYYPGTRCGHIECAIAEVLPR